MTQYKLWRGPSLQGLGGGRFFSLLLLLIIFDVAPAPGENYSRCGSEYTPLVELELVASKTEIDIGEDIELEARGRWENGDNRALESSALWSVEPEGIVELSSGTYSDGYNRITGLAAGVATITVVADEIEATIDITVLPDGEDS